MILRMNQKVYLGKEKAGIQGRKTEYVFVVAASHITTWHYNLILQTVSLHDIRPLNILSLGYIY